MTLNSKEKALLETIAMPECGDYRFSNATPELATLLTEALNRILADALIDMKSAVLLGEQEHLTDLAEGVLFPRMRELHQRYRDQGLFEEPVRTTVARFFGINLHPHFYALFRGRRAETL